MSIDALDTFLDRNSANVAHYLRVIEDMLGDYKSYHYAEQTLADIHGTIEKTGRVTPGQIKAIENIKKKPSKFHARTQRRR